MKISVDEIYFEGFEIVIKFSFSEELSVYFLQNEMRYSCSLENEEINLANVPNSILVIPWICNVLPIAWLTDSTITVDTLDRAFYESIDDFKQGYIDMHKDANFLGKVEVNKIEENICPELNKSSMFFSAGVDAYGTLVRHIKEKPDLVTIWGADIPYDNEEGWNILKNGIAKSASELDLPLITIHSSFRKMLNEYNLTRKFYPVLHDGWWHAAQHGIGLIGHAAPIDFYRNITTHYIAATFCPGVKVSCASWPSIDNNVRFFNCRVYHDGFISRQEKISSIVSEHVKEKTPINLHVCWKTTNGENCCICEKCSRTIIGLYAEGADPNEYGFSVGNDISKQIKLCKNVFEYDVILIPLWNQIKQKVIENKESIVKAGNWDKVQWICDYDFNNAHKSFGRRVRRIKKKVHDKIYNTFFRK